MPVDIVRFLSLDITHLRNLGEVSLSLEAGVNYFFGPNGAGKTAVLEAVGLLARGRSFRTTQIGELITFGEDGLLVRAAIESEAGVRHTLGLVRTRSGKTEVRVDGQPGRRLSDVARLLPVQVLLPSLSELVFGSPSERRQWLDWGLFHVKPEYLGGLKGYLQVLRQRNAGLKEFYGGRLGSDVLDIWSRRLAEKGEVIDAWRVEYLAGLILEVNQLLALLSPGLEVRFEYRRGWSEGAPLEKVLSESLSRDVKSGSTSAGPHRSDVDIRVGKGPGARASAVLSRGQGKILASAMILGQARFLRRLTGRNSVFLIDDLGAELDPEHTGKLFDVLADMGSQVLATSAQAPGSVQLGRAGPIRMFHVEHGSVRLVQPDAD